MGTYNRHRDRYKNPDDPGCPRNPNYPSNRTSRHIHNYRGSTSFNDNHRHTFNEVTGPPIYNKDTHYHNYQGTTSTTDGHQHNYRGRTGPAIRNSFGGHIHQMEGSTTVNNNHRHNYETSTSRPNPIT